MFAKRLVAPSRGDFASVGQRGSAVARVSVRFAWVENAVFMGARPSIKITIKCWLQYPTQTCGVSDVARLVSFKTP